MPANLSSLLSQGAEVFARCLECGWSKDVDLEKLLAEAGDLDLTDRHPPCRRCSYWVNFYALHGQRVRCLVTKEGDRVASERRTEWLGLGCVKTTHEPIA